MRREPLLSAALVVALVVFAGCGPEDAPYQSDRRPLELAPIDTVKAAGSDRRAARFMETMLPELTRLAAGKFTADNVASNFEQIALDPARLRITHRTRVRVYFVGDASGYKNALGINTEGHGAGEGNPRLLFPLAQTAPNLYGFATAADADILNAAAAAERTADTPLAPGDFVDLGSIPSNTGLNFFLVADSTRDVNVYTTDPSRNPDNTRHVVSVAIEGSPYLLLSFEDMFGGGDKDYSDCVFAVETSELNIQELIGKIDPWRRARQLALLAAVLTVFIGGPTGWLAWRRYVRKKRREAAYRRASELVNAGQPREALRLLRSNQSLAQTGPDHEPWARLELTASKQAGDIAELRELYARDFEVLAEDETASLSVGRLQVEADELAEFHNLRQAWRKREQAPGGWLALEADVLLKQERPQDAAQLLEAGAPASDEDAGRLARLAWLHVGNNPKRAAQLLEQAAYVDPSNPEVHVFRARCQERLGRPNEALASFTAALKCAPQDPLLRDQLAEFHRRQGDMAAALDVWRKSLAPPSLDLIWLKFLFWRKVAVPHGAPLDEIERPPGPLMPLIDALAAAPADVFWTARATEVVGDEPQMEKCQETFWLRLLEALRRGDDEQALALLNLSRFEARSWRPDLESALRNLLVFRRTGFMEPGGGPADALRTAHPLFAMISAVVERRPEELAALKLLAASTSIVFAAACFAVGWHCAGVLLLDEEALKKELPNWLSGDIAAGLAGCPGTRSARLGTIVRPGQTTDVAPRRPRPDAPA